MALQPTRAAMPHMQPTGPTALAPRQAWQASLVFPAFSERGRYQDTPLRWGKADGLVHRLQLAIGKGCRVFRPVSLSVNMQALNGNRRVQRASLRGDARRAAPRPLLSFPQASDAPDLSGIVPARWRQGRGLGAYGKSPRAIWAWRVPP